MLDTKKFDPDTQRSEPLIYGGSIAGIGGIGSIYNNSIVPTATTLATTNRTNLIKANSKVFALRECCTSSSDDNTTAIKSKLNSNQRRATIRPRGGTHNHQYSNSSSDDLNNDILWKFQCDISNVSENPDVILINKNQNYLNRDHNSYHTEKNGDSSVALTTTL